MYKSCSSLLLRKAVSKRNFKLLLDRAAVLQLGLVEALQVITILDAKSGNTHLRRKQYKRVRTSTLASHLNSTLQGTKLCVMSWHCKRTFSAEASLSCGREAGKSASEGIVILTYIYHVLAWKHSAFECIWHVRILKNRLGPPYLETQRIHVPMHIPTGDTPYLVPRMLYEAFDRENWL